MEYFYSAVFCSDLDILTDSVNGIIEELGGIIPSDEIVLETRVILNELIINGFLHGNRCCREKNIRLSITLDGANLAISVEDEGSGICRDEVSKLPKLSTHGRGLTIVERLSDEMVIKKNHIQIHKAVR